MDDIDFLLKNSEKDSSLFVIDSSHRDRNKYPTPAEYVLDFTQPFRFVYGFDIIDATIPSTMYGVDTHNNVLCFGVLSSPDRYQDLAKAVSVCPGLLSVYSEQTAPVVDFAFCNSVPRRVQVRASTTDDAYLVIGNIIQRVTRATMEDVIANGEFDFTLRAVRFEIEAGNYSISTLQTYLKKNLRPYGIDVRSATVDAQVEKQMRYRFVHYDPVLGTSSPFYLDMFKSTCGTVLGFDELPEEGRAGEYRRGAFYGKGAGDQVFASVMNNTEGVYQIVGPGVVNLLGVRYITLRCPEIESHLLGSLGYDSQNNTGLGIFKLQSPYEVSNLKFDFFNFVKKPFHPIGKLNKLSIRFERGAGMLYNFRGINHQILVSIKYYVPSMANMRAPTYVLNPNYQPDHLKFIVEREEILNDDEDDDDEYEDDDDRELLKKYVYMRNNP